MYNVIRTHEHQDACDSTTRGTPKTCFIYKALFNFMEGIDGGGLKQAGEVSPTYV